MPAIRATRKLVRGHLYVDGGIIDLFPASR
jgi:hypothetical protein